MINPLTLFKDLLYAALHPPVTQLYPLEKQPAPLHLRGRLHWNPTNCTGCALCNKDCPASALTLFVLDKKAKRFAMDYYPERCIYCGQCATSCRFNCIQLINEEWELATYSHQQIHYGEADDVENTPARDPGKTKFLRPSRDHRDGESATAG